MIHLVLLSGGSGTRLWPLSNETRSKQFLKVLRDERGNHISMVQRVFKQISDINARLDVTIATTESQALSIEQQIEGIYALVIEPERRDTFPAVMLACAHLMTEQHASVEDTVVVMPIDTFADQAYYDKIVELDKVLRKEDSELVLLGVEPTYPSEKYGYIVPDVKFGSPRHVSLFVEKPDEITAKDLISQGALWNCGVFTFKLGYAIDILAKRDLGTSFAQVREGYSKLTKTSFDYAVVEKADSVSVVPYAGTWRDLGTWNTLTEEMEDTVSGRVVMDEDTCSNVHVINETGMPLVVSGVHDAVVVATHDGILVSGKDESRMLKQFVSKAAETRPMYEKRRWGEYRVIDYSVYPDGRKSLTKELILNPGSQLSYQKHRNRSEIWTIVSGSGLLVLNGDMFFVQPGSVVDIPACSKHALKADTELHLIEVQLGSLLDECDIERFGNYWSD